MDDPIQEERSDIMALERHERIRLLEIAAEAGASSFELTHAAQEMEAYVLGQSVSVPQDGPRLFGEPPTETKN